MVMVITTTVMRTVTTMTIMITMRMIKMMILRYSNCFLARTDPKDVARTEGRTFLCSDKKRDSIPCVDTAQVMVMIMIIMMMLIMIMWHPI